MVVSSAKLQISQSNLIRQRSFINMLKSNGPRTDPCGTPILFCSRHFAVNQS
eukprot:UN09243